LPDASEKNQEQRGKPRSTTAKIESAGHRSDNTCVHANLENPPGISA
jgi:hypothetical protein